MKDLVSLIPSGFSLVETLVGEHHKTKRNHDNNVTSIINNSLSTVGKLGLVYAAYKAADNFFGNSNEKHLEVRHGNSSLTARSSR